MNMSVISNLYTRHNIEQNIKSEIITNTNLSKRYFKQTKLNQNLKVIQMTLYNNYKSRFSMTARDSVNNKYLPYYNWQYSLFTKQLIMYIIQKG